jgi:hypothetical protein
MAQPGFFPTVFHTLPSKTQFPEKIGRHAAASRADGIPIFRFLMMRYESSPPLVVLQRSPHQGAARNFGPVPLSFLIPISRAARFVLRNSTYLLTE